MGTYATMAIILSIVFYANRRKDLKLFNNSQGYNMSLSKTNFHAEKSEVRPFRGVYITGTLNNVYDN